MAYDELLGASSGLMVMPAGTGRAEDRTPPSSYKLQQGTMTQTPEPQHAALDKVRASTPPLPLPVVAADLLSVPKQALEQVEHLKQQLQSANTTASTATQQLAAEREAHAATRKAVAASEAALHRAEAARREATDKLVRIRGRAVAAEEVAHELRARCEVLRSEAAALREAVPASPGL